MKQVSAEIIVVIIQKEGDITVPPQITYCRFFYSSSSSRELDDYLILLLLRGEALNSSKLPQYSDFSINYGGDFFILVFQ